MKKPVKKRVKKVIRRKSLKKDNIIQKKFKRKNPTLNIKEKPAFIYSIDIPNRIYVVLKRNPRTELGGTAFIFDNEFKGYIQKIDFDYALYLRYSGNTEMLQKLLDLNDLYLDDENIIGFVTGPEFYSSTKAPLINRLKKEV